MAPPDTRAAKSKTVTQTRKKKVIIDLSDDEEEVVAKSYGIAKKANTNKVEPFNGQKSVARKGFGGVCLSLMQSNFIV